MSTNVSSAREREMEGTNMDRIKAKREKRDPLNEEEDGQRCYIRTKKIERERAKAG
jgi:hypothetical protein